MDQINLYLRGLASGTLIYLAVFIAFTRPEFYLSRDLHLQGLPYRAAEITGTVLTIATGVLGLVASAQRGQRPWAAAFLLLLLLIAYSPLLPASMDPQAYYAALSATFRDPRVVSLLDIGLRFLPSAAVALLALAYSLRTRLPRAGAIHPSIVGTGSQG